MLAGMSRKFEVYDLLVNTYGADESLRDYSGKMAAGYMEQRHLPLPGVAQRVDIRQMEDEVNCSGVIIPAMICYSRWRTLRMMLTWALGGGAGGRWRGRPHKCSSESSGTA